MTPPAFFKRSALGRTLWTFKREFFWVGVFSFFANLLLLAPTLYMLQVFDRVMISGSELTLLALTIITVFFFVVMGFSEWLRSRLLVRTGAKFDEALNSQVFTAAFESSLRGNKSGATQPMTDLAAIRQFATGNGVFVFFDLPWAPIYIVVLFLMHPWLGWAAIGFAVLLAGLAFASNRFTSKGQVRAQDGTMVASNYLQSKLRNAETVQALGMLGNLRRQWLARYERQLVWHGQAYDANHKFQAVMKFVQYTQQSMMLAIGALLAIAGHISAGAMVASNALAGNALRPLSTLVGSWKQFVDARQAYYRLEKLLQDNPERTGLYAGEAPVGQVSLRDLVARAPGREQPILKGLNAEFKAGEVVAIIGPSGAGKSTLARCLVGIWPDAEGDVLIDGRPVTQWSREALGPHIGYLPQDVGMFDGSIAENIARFAQVDSPQVIAAAVATGIHDMVLRLPRGYDTPMGEAGQMLSGGQRQRIGLARAIYGSPQIVVLDEPNASLDDAGEAALVRTVRELKAQGKTVFMIVHQQHLLVVCDRALVLEDGRIKNLLPIEIKTAAPQLEVQA